MTSTTGFFGAVAEHLKFVAPSYLGKQRLGQNLQRTRYVWVPTGDAFEDADGRGRTGRQLHDRIARLEAHCFGTTIDQAEMLRAALATALRYHAGPRGYVLGQATWVNQGEVDASWELVQPFTVRLPFFAVTIPDTGPVPQPAPDDAYAYVTPTSVEAVVSPDVIPVLGA